MQLPAREAMTVQVPFKLGWALTIHKAQGMTFASAEVHLEGAVTAEQIFVALSRLTSTNGLWIRRVCIFIARAMAHPRVIQSYWCLSGYDQRAVKRSRPLDLLFYLQRANPPHAASTWVEEWGIGWGTAFLGRVCDNCRLAYATYVDCNSTHGCTWTFESLRKKHKQIGMVQRRTSAFRRMTIFVVWKQQSSTWTLMFLVSLLCNFWIRCCISYIVFAIPMSLLQFPCFLYYFTSVECV